MQPLELLCPAKNAEFGKTAINYGADAVYIGAENFGARAAASNPLGDIEELCNYAHIYNAKVYIALNTILYGHELEKARSLIYDLWNAGADALIVQDMAILEMDIPPIRLHASTQAHNFDLNRIAFLEKSGIARAVLARELSINEIDEIAKNCNIELEAFIHGALCVSLSGQCYMSHATTKRSANRGECSQSCRMPYRLTDSNNKQIVENSHLLSLKDFDASKHILRLARAGVRSFKIEGRLKDKSYIINNTSYYRQLFDEIIGNHPEFEKASYGKTQISFQPDTAKTFNRGYTSYFLDSRNKNMISPLTPKSMGKRVGSIVKVQTDRIWVNTTEELRNGDGLCFVNCRNQLSGFNVSKTNGEQIFLADTSEIPVGAELYRNFDYDFEKKLQADNSKRRIDISLTFAETPTGAMLTVTDEQGMSTQTGIDMPKIEARDVEGTPGAIERQLKKSGETVFNVGKVDVVLESPLFFKSSVLNELRRLALENHKQFRMDNYKRLMKTNTDLLAPYYEPSVAFNANISNSLAKRFYEKHGAKVIGEAFELQSPEQWLSKPVMTTRYCIKFELGMCPSKQNNKDKSTITEPLFLEDKNRKYRLSFDCRKCMMQIFLHDNKTV